MGKSNISFGQILIGSLFNELMRAESVQIQSESSWVLRLVGAKAERFGRVTLSRQDLESLTILNSILNFESDAKLLKPSIQAYSSGISCEFDPFSDLSANSLMSIDDLAD